MHRSTPTLRTGTTQAMGDSIFRKRGFRQNPRECAWWAEGRARGGGGTRRSERDVILRLGRRYEGEEGGGRAGGARRSPRIAGSALKKTHAAASGQHGLWSCVAKRAGDRRLGTPFGHWGPPLHARPPDVPGMFAFRSTRSRASADTPPPPISSARQAQGPLWEGSASQAYAFCPRGYALAQPGVLTGFEVLDERGVFVSVG